jgi:hypothetical protein
MCKLKVRFLINIRFPDVWKSFAIPEAKACIQSSKIRVQTGPFYSEAYLFSGDGPDPDRLMVETRSSFNSQFPNGPDRRKKEKLKQAPKF